MGLLQKAEEKKRELLVNLTKEKKKYIDHISKERKNLIHKEIKKQRTKVISKGLLIKGVKIGTNKKIIKQKSIIIKPQKVKKVISEIPQKLISPKKSLSKIEPAKIKSLEPILPATDLTALTDFGEVSKAPKKDTKDYIFTGIPGFDDLLDEGIPRNSAVLVAGGAGSGKTIFGLQTLYNHAKKGEKCLYISFEESEDKLIKHMNNFGWKADELIKKKKLVVLRMNPFDITRQVDALLMKAKGELLIEVDPIIFPDNFVPDLLVIDSLTAIASAFTGKEDSYRIYIEQLFRFFEKIKTTSFMITETEQIPKIFSTTGVEEFLADGVIVLYAIKRGNIRENAVEILKMRGVKHQKKIVAMQITDQGITVYPEQEVFGGTGE